jgi:hypothetical protein
MNDCTEVKEISMHIRLWISKQPAVKEETQENIIKALNIEDEFSSDAQSTLGLHKSIPNYISVLMKQEINKEKENDIDKWYEGEFKTQIQDINAIMVYDLREYE